MSEGQPGEGSGGRLAGAALWLGAGLLPLGVYLSTFQRTVPAGDSAELITVVHTFGVAHPPGYPLYTLLGKLFTLGASPEVVALRLNLMSVLLSVATLLVLARVVYRLSGSRVAALLTALALAFSSPFWKNALVAEVFALNGLLAALLLLAFATLLDQSGLLPSATRPRPRGGEGARPWPLHGMALLSGLLVAHHHTLILLAAPVFGVGILLLGLPEGRVRSWLPSFRRPYPIGARRALTLVATGVLGLLPLAQIPWAASGDPLLSWDDPRTLEAFLHLLLRRDYGTLSLASQEQGLQAGVSHGWLYLQSIPRDFTVGCAILAAVGAWAVWGRQWRPLLVVLASFALLQAIFFTLVDFPTDPPVYRGVVERFYILPDMAIALLVGLGGAALLSRVPDRGRAALAGLLLLLPMVSLAWHWKAVSQRENRFTLDLGRNLLASLPRNAVLFSHGDLYTNAIHYGMAVEGERPDVVFLDQTLMSYDWYVRAARRRHPGVLPPLGKGERIHLLGDGSLEGQLVENHPDRPYLRWGSTGRSLVVDKRLVESLARDPKGERIRWVGRGILEGKILEENARAWGVLGAWGFLTRDAYLWIDKALVERLERSPDPAGMFVASKRLYRVEPGSEDRYSGNPDTMNLLWLDHLAGRRPVAFLGFKDSSYQVRYEPVQRGLVQLMVPKGGAPKVEERIRTALELLETLDLTSAARAYDPWSFETDSKLIYWIFVTSVVDLLVRPEAAAFPPDRFPGVETLVAFLEGQAASGASPESLRALGALRYANPHLRDPDQALASFEAYLQLAPTGAEADNARSIVEFLRRARGPGEGQ